MSQGANNVIIAECSAPERVHVARELMREYAASLPFPLDYQGFEQEMDALPGAYDPPAGCMLVAFADGQASGLIAMRPLAESGYRTGDLRPCCEMKRMYVRPAFRGRGLGRVLAEELLARAQRAGYAMMKLDTEATFVEATGLYRSLGFEECERYNDDPQPETIWMRKALA